MLDGDAVIDPMTILVTGGNGLLCRELRRQIPQACFTDLPEFDVTDYARMEAFVGLRPMKAILHAAAFTSPPLVNKDPLRAMEVNIVGTANVVKLCMSHGLKMVYISTDYVFKGDQGNYSEDAPVFPVNKYAWSKLGGECAVRLYDNSLIIRTTFGPNEFPYPKAFVDQWTSRESVRVIAAMIARAAQSALTGTVHVGGARKTVYEYARSVSPEKAIGQLSIRDVSFSVPVDTSMNCSRYLREVAGESQAAQGDVLQ